jgi:hypothetical protein
MKTVFLDFDGVLNSISFLVDRNDSPPPLDVTPPDGIWALEEASDPLILSSMVSQVNPVAVEKLNALLLTTGAKVVVSSTWRLTLSTTGLQWVLDLAGFKGEVIGSTPWIRPPRGEYLPRGKEIRQWLQEHPGVESFVILDDDSDMDDLDEFFVKVNNRVGLQDTDVEKAVNILLK